MSSIILVPDPTEHLINVRFGDEKALNYLISDDKDSTVSIY